MSEHDEKRDKNRKAEIPEIITNNRPIQDISDECYHAVINSNNPPYFFKQERNLIRLIPNDNKELVPEIVDKVILKHELARRMKFVRKSYLNGQVITNIADPTNKLVEDLLARKEWDVPYLKKIVHIPFFHSDGTLITTTGYDGESNLYYDPSQDLSNIDVPQSISEYDINKAKRDLLEPLMDFPFADQASTANAIALIITPMLMPEITEKSPICCVDASKLGSGKGLLVSVNSVIHTGREAEVSHLPEDDEELRKKITSHLLIGSPILFFDNVETKVDSPVLAAAVTSTIWNDRLLGKNVNLSLPQNTIFIISGNNIQLGGDLPRRIYWIRLIPQSSTPWLRKNFKYPQLLDWVKKNRKKLIESILILIKSWFMAGKPLDYDSTIGSFEAWSQTIGGILNFIGVEGFLRNGSELTKLIDTDAEEWEVFLRILYEKFGSKPITIKNLIEIIQRDPIIHGVIPSCLMENDLTLGSNNFKSLLGKEFSKRKNSRYGEENFSLDRGINDSHTKAATWFVSCGGCGGCGG